MKVKKGDIVRIESPMMGATDKTVFEVRGVQGDKEYDSQDWSWAKDGCTIKTEKGDFPNSVGEEGGFYWIDREMILEVAND